MSCYTLNANQRLSSHMSLSDSFTGAHRCPTAGGARRKVKGWAQMPGFILWGSLVFQHQDRIFLTLPGAKECMGVGAFFASFSQQPKDFHDNLGTAGQRWTFLSTFTATVPSKQQRCSWFNPAECQYLVETHHVFWLAEMSCVHSLEQPDFKRVLQGTQERGHCWL